MVLIVQKVFIKNINFIKNFFNLCYIKNAPLFIMEQKNVLISVISSIFVLWTLNTLDLLSVGTNIYKQNSHGDRLESFNMTIYIIVLVAAQCIYGGFSKINAGICGGPIYEAASMTRDIHEKCEKLTSTSTESVSNALAIVFISTIIFSFISYLLGRFKAGKIFEFIPKTAIYGVVSSIGLKLFWDGKDEIYIIERINTTNYNLDLCFAVTIVLIILAYFLERKFSGYIFFLPVFSFMIVVSFYIFFFSLGYNMNYLRENLFIPHAEDLNMSMKGFTKFIDFSKFKLSILIACIPKMASMIFTNLIHITVNVPGFSTLMNVSINLSDEFKTQSYGNLITAFLGYPSYFINCTSYIFNKSGGTSKFYSITAGFSMILMLYLGPKARIILPRILLAFIPMYFGICFVMSNFVEQIGQLPISDLVIIIVSCIMGFFVNAFSGLLVGTFLSMLFNYLYKKPLYPINIIEDTEEKN